jgi:hypothetical protein
VIENDDKDDDKDDEDDAKLFPTPSELLEASLASSRQHRRLAGGTGVGTSMISCSSRYSIYITVFRQDL